MWHELFALTYRYLRARGLSHADAEDIAQDTLLVTYQNLDGIEPGKLRAWVCTVARNKHTDAARRQARAAASTRVVESIPEDQDPLEVALLAEDRVAVHTLLAALPDADRRLLELKYIEDRTVEEIAGILGRPVNTVKVGLFRARRRGRAQLERGRP